MVSIRCGQLVSLYRFGALASIARRVDSGSVPMLHVKAVCAAAEAWASDLLLAIGLETGDLASEVQPVSCATWLSALRFLAAKRTESGATVSVQPAHYLGDDQLAAWAPMLRSAKAPEVLLAALAQEWSLGCDGWFAIVCARSPGNEAAQLVLTVSWKDAVDGPLGPADRELVLAALCACVCAALTLLGFPNTQTSIQGERLHVQYSAGFGWPLLASYAGVGALLALVLPVFLEARIAALVLGFVVGSFLALRKPAEKVGVRAEQWRTRVLERALRVAENAPKLSPIIGSVIASAYRVQELIDAGAMGAVYRVVDIRTERLVAMKILRSASLGEVSTVDRLRREAEALALAWHPNVVECLDQGRLPSGSTYLVMEHLTGQTLEGKLQTPLRVPELMQVATQLLGAMAAIHGAGVIHRDIKPANIFLVQSSEVAGAEPTLKLIDFGIAQIAWEEMRMTGGGMLLGTPLYMTPEHRARAADGPEQGALEPDPKVDLYAAGVTLIECLIGSEALNRLGADHVAAFEKVLPIGIPDGIVAILRKSVAANASERFADAAEFLQAFAAERRSS
jgi:tRNA A-37 threonylcarbamoyl transferase component Bud32